MLKRSLQITLFLAAMTSGFVSIVSAQERFPENEGLSNYHTAPNYRESESHPLRLLGYILHPIGWVAREVVFRPLSYFASSTEQTRSIMGYRDPFDFRQPTCYSSDDAVPDCRTVMPFSQSGLVRGQDGVISDSANTASMKQVYLPDVNFDFNSKALNDLGEGRVRQLAQLLNDSGNVKIVLEGHADFRGSDDYNQKLGLDRADVVRTKLVELGVEPDRLSSVTFGESQPVFSEQSDWARAVNRRVSVQSGE